MHSTVTRVLPWDACLFSYNQTPPVACNHWTRASYVVWNEFVVRPSLQEVDRNVPTGDIINWNILDAMWGISLALKSTMPAVIQARFAKCGVCPGSSVNTNNIEKCEWKDLQSHIDCPITSNKFVNVDECIPITVIIQQVRTSLAPGPCMWWMRNSRKQGNHGCFPFDPVAKL